MLVRDMLARLPRESLYRLLYQARALPDYRCTTQLRFALTGAWKSGRISDQSIINEYHDHIGV